GAHGAVMARPWEVLDVFRADGPAHDLARDLADEVVVRRHLAAHNRDPETAACVDRDHARVAADRIAREHHARDLGVHHRLDGHAHRVRALPESGPVADGTRRVEARPAVAHRVAQMIDAAHPQEALLLAGVARCLAVLAYRSGAYGHRRALAAQLAVALRELVAQLGRQRRGGGERPV